MPRSPWISYHVHMSTEEIFKTPTNVLTLLGIAKASRRHSSISDPTSPDYRCRCATTGRPSLTNKSILWLWNPVLAIQREERKVQQMKVHQWLTQQDLKTASLLCGCLSTNPSPVALLRIAGHRPHTQLNRLTDWPNN